MTNDTAGTNDIPRATGLIIVEVRNSNPNGDPERDTRNVTELQENAEGI